MTSRNDDGEQRTDSDYHDPDSGYAQELERYKKESHFLRTRAIIWGILIVLFILGLSFVFKFEDQLAEWSWTATLPKNPDKAAAKILAVSPVIVRFSTYLWYMSNMIYFWLIRTDTSVRSKYFVCATFRSLTNAVQ